MPDSLPYTPALEGTLLDELNHRIKNELASVYASSEDDCYNVSAYRRNGYYRRVLRCGGN